MSDLQDFKLNVLLGEQEVAINEVRVVANGKIFVPGTNILAACMERDNEQAKNEFGNQHKKIKALIATETLTETSSASEAVFYKLNAKRAVFLSPDARMLLEPFFVHAMPATLRKAKQLFWPLSPLHAARKTSGSAFYKT